VVPGIGGLGLKKRAGKRAGTGWNVMESLKGKCEIFKRREVRSIRLYSQKGGKWRDKKERREGVSDDRRGELTG